MEQPLENQILSLLSDIRGQENSLRADDASDLRAQKEELITNARAALQALFLGNEDAFLSAVDLLDDCDRAETCRQLAIDEKAEALRLKLKNVMHRFSARDDVKKKKPAGKKK